MSNGQQTRDKLEANIATAQEQILAFNNHWLNHKHLINGFAVCVMGLIFLGMLIESIALYMWILCGIMVIALVCVMAWRGKQATLLNELMETAQRDFKEYERSRRKKK